MCEIIITTPEQLKKIITDCFSLGNGNLSEQIISTDSPNFLYSIKDLAEFLHVSIVTAWKLKKSGKIRYIQHGRKLIFNTEEILQDLQNNNKRRVK